MKLPIQLTKVDLPDVMYIPIRIEVGPANKNEINETLEGKIIECTLAAYSTQFARNSYISDHRR